MLFCSFTNIFGINSHVVYYLCRLQTTKLLNKSSEDSTVVPEAAGEALAIETDAMVLHGRHSPAFLGGVYSPPATPSPGWLLCFMTTCHSPNLPNAMT